MHGQTPTEVHLVGSVGLDTVDDVFNTAGPLLGRRLRRIPDGPGWEIVTWRSESEPDLAPEIPDAFQPPPEATPKDPKDPGP